MSAKALRGGERKQLLWIILEEEWSLSYPDMELSWTHRIASANPSFFRGIHSGLSRIILEEEWSVSYPELELSWTHSIDNLIHSGLLWIILEEECSVSYSDMELSWTHSIDNANLNYFRCTVGYYELF